MSNAEPKKRQRRASFCGYPSRNEIGQGISNNLVDVDKEAVANWWSQWSSPYISVRSGYKYLHIRYPPNNTVILHQLNSRLGIRTSKYWPIHAAPEMLPPLLRPYDLRTTGHDFEYGKVQEDPIAGQIPSRCRDFRKMCIDVKQPFEDIVKQWSGVARLLGMI